MRRFFIPRDLWGESLELPLEERRHATVLRMKPGDEALVFDGEGNEVPVRIVSLDRHKGTVVPIDAVRYAGTDLRLVLGQGLPKGSKLEELFRHATELGLTELYPLLLDRSVARPGPEKDETRRDRWKRIALEAAKQCRRADIPRIHRVGPLEPFLEHFVATGPQRKGLVLYEEAPAERPISRVLEGWSAPGPEGVWLLVGPEGGLEADEVARAEAAGLSSVSLGPRILRTEIAGLAVLAVLQYLWGWARQKGQAEP